MKIARRNQRRCLTCRLGKAARWIDGRKSKCTGCRAPYIAWGTRRDWPHCGACLLARAPMGLRESVKGECARHKTNPGGCRSGTEAQDTWLYSADFRMCFPCLTDPEHFEENQKLILAKVKRLQDRLNGGTVEGKR